MQKIKELLHNLRHPAAIAALIFTLFIPLLIAWAGDVSMAGQDMKDLVGQLDLYLPFWLFLAQLLLLVLLLFDLSKDLVQFVKSVSPGRNWWFATLGLVLLCTAAAGFWISGHHRVQSDESIFLSTAQNLYSEQVAGACDEGMFDSDEHLDCTKNANNFKARGLAFIYMLGMPVLGQDLQWIFPFHLVLFFLTGLLFFLAIYAWTRNAFLALLSAVILMVQPTVMFQFRSASVEPLYVFLSALSLLLMKWAFERDTVRHWVILALVLAFFAQTRQETAFCLGAFVFMSLPKLLSKKDLRFPAFISALTWFSIPILLTISYHQGYNFQGGEYSAHGNFLKDIAINWGVMANTPVTPNGLLENPFLSSFTWFAVLGGLTLLYLAWKDKEARNWLIFLLLYHIQTYMVLENVSGDFTIEINQRYALVFLPTMAFLAALFFDKLLFGEWIRGKGEKPIVPTIAWAVVTALVMMGLSYRYYDSFKADIMYNRNHLTNEEIQILDWVRSQPKQPRLFIYARPWHFIGYGYSSMHYDKFKGLGGGDLAALQQRFNGEIYYVRGLDCWNRQTWHKKAVEHRIASTCDEFERDFETRPVFQTIITNNYELSISKIIGPKDYDETSLAGFQEFSYSESSDAVVVAYTLANVPPKKWHYQLSLNDSIWRDGPYQPQTYRDTLMHPNIVSGYNSIHLAVFDSNGTQISSRDQEAFFSKGKAAVRAIELTPQNVQQSWGDFHINKTVNGSPFHLGKRAFQDGFGTHAFSHIDLPLGGKYRRFTALVGQDDEEPGGDGVAFRILGDGKLLWSSHPLMINPTDVNHLSQELADVSLSGVQILTLEVDSLTNNLCDHADWIHPTLYP
ncbi:MAG TPA: NPCBM/NEW2 domain-containing protein [Fibrobacteraceae bacterium]|nr:NPCBM/NEW2 domain-containing protein [Fibrobacteraceae bacterium]